LRSPFSVLLLLVPLFLREFLNCLSGFLAAGRIAFFCDAELSVILKRAARAGGGFGILAGTEWL
jgi:hypothetical protein